MIHIKKNAATESQDCGWTKSEWRYTGVGNVDADEVVIWVGVDKARIEDKFRFFGGM